VRDSSGHEWYNIHIKLCDEARLRQTVRRAGGEARAHKDGMAIS
jgi:hypothetical protein